MRVDRFVEELLRLRIDQQRPQRDQVEADHRDRPGRQLLQPGEQGRVSNQALDQVGVGVELALDLQLSVDEFLELEVAAGGLHLSRLTHQPRGQVALVDGGPVLESDAVDSRTDDSLKLLELLRGDGKHLVDGIADGDLLEEVAAVVLNELKHSLGISGLERTQGLSSLGLQPEVTGDGLSDLLTDQLDQDKAGSAGQRFRRQSQVLGGDGGPPASGEELVRLVDAFGLEVAEEGLVQLIQVFAQRDLEKR